MKSFRPLILIFAVSLLFIGNVGVDVFKHICKKDGVSVSVFVEPDHHCKEETNAHACCSAQDKDDCCDDEVSHFQIKLDYFNKFQEFQFISQEMSFEPVWITAEIVVENTTVQQYPQPPPLSGRDILVLKQVFVI